MSSARDSADSDNPFLGPNPLSGQQPVFGRDEDIAALRSLIIAERVVVMHGVSGAGKSSLLKGYGGIRTSFQKEKGFSVLGPIDLRIVITENIQDIYHRTLVEDIVQQNENDSEELRNLFDNELLDLENLIMHFARAAGSSYQLLIIDQFEDIFSRLPHDEDGRNNFFKMLGEILDRNEGLKVLLSMRDEYLGEIDRFRHFIPGRLRATFRLELLRKQQAFDAITLTAKREPYDVHLCAKEVAGMVNDLSNLGASDLGGKKAQQWESHFVEPLFLQLACRDAWPGIFERSKNLELSADDGETPCVSLEGSASTKELDAVLGRFYENIVGKQKSNTADGDEIKLRLFVQDGLITPSGMRNLIGAEKAVEYWGLSEKAIDALVQAHLVRPQRRNRGTFYELAHDRLLAPIKINNEEWFKTNLPDWRKSARLVVRGGSDQSLSVSKVFRAHLENKRKTGSLLPYERSFLKNNMGKYKRKYLLRGVALILVWIIGVYSYSLTGYKAAFELVVANNKEAFEIQDAINKAAIKDQQAAFEKQEAEIKGHKELLAIQDDISKVQRLMGPYAQRKWQERNDESAILQVREAYNEAGILFGPDEIPAALTRSFLTAFNNAMTPIEGAPGFARTISLGLDQKQPVAIHSGNEPKVAYYNVKKSCLEIKNLDQKPVSVNCVQKSSAQPLALYFDQYGHYLAARYTKGLSIFDLTKNDLYDGFPVTQQFESGQPVDLFSFSADGTRISYLSKGSVKVLCNKGMWAECAKGAISTDLTKFTKMAISQDVNGKRRIVIARGNGGIVPMVFDDKLAGDKVVSIENLTPIKQPDKKYHIKREIREVLYIGFTGKDQMLVVVHRDTQKFLWKMNEDDTQLERWSIVPEKGIFKPSTQLEEEGRKYYQAATVSADNKLFTVLDDEITKWELSTSNINWNKPKNKSEKGQVSVPTVRWKTGSRSLKQLSVSKELLIGRGFFKLWLWEQGRSLESKLIHSRFPAANQLKKGVFYPHAISFGRDNKIFVGTSQHGLMRWGPGTDGVWEPDGLSVCEGFESISVRSVALSPALSPPDQGLIALAMGVQNKTGPGHLMVLPLSGDEDPLCNNTVHEDGLWAVAFSPDGHWLVSGDYDGKAHIWKVKKNKVEHHGELKLKNNDIIRSIAFHPEYNLLAIGKRKWSSANNVSLGIVELVRIGNNGQQVESNILEFPEGEIGAILDVAFSNDGDSLVAAGENGPIRLWMIKVDKKIKVVSSRLLSGHAGGTTALAFNPKLDYLASGGKDGLVRVWDLKDTTSTSPSANLKGIDADVLSLSWQKDGKQLAVSYKHPSVGSKELPNKGIPEDTHGKVAIWYWDLSQISKAVCETTWRPLTQEEWANWIQPVSNQPYNKAACAP